MKPKHQIAATDNDVTLSGPTLENVADTSTRDDKVKEAARIVLDALKSPKPLRAWLESDAFNAGLTPNPNDCRYCATSMFLTYVLRKRGYSKSAKAVVIDDAIVLWVCGVKQLLTAPAWVCKFEARLRGQVFGYRTIAPLTAAKELELME